MNLRRLGNRGPVVTALGIGCWAIGGPTVNLGRDIGWSTASDEGSREGLKRALDLGVNHFDVADAYGLGHAERLLGEAVQGVPRQSLVLGSKVGYFRGTAVSGYHPRQMSTQLENSLENLGTDYLDIYAFHHNEFGPNGEFLDGAVELMNRWKEKGIVRFVAMRAMHRFTGATAGQPSDDPLASFLALAERVRPDIIQLKFNLMSPQTPRAIAAWAETQGAGLIVNKVFGQGLLLNKYEPEDAVQFPRGDHRHRKIWYKAESLRVLKRRLSAVKESLGITDGDLPSLALSCSLGLSAAAGVVVGFTSPEQVVQNIKASERSYSEGEVAIAMRILAGVEDEMRQAAGGAGL